MLSLILLVTFLALSLMQGQMYPHKQRWSWSSSLSFIGKIWQKREIKNENFGNKVILEVFSCHIFIFCFHCVAKKIGELAKNRWFSSWFFDFFIFSENDSYIPKLVLWIFWELMGKWVYSLADNRCVLVLDSKKHPTMVGILWVLLVILHQLAEV